MVPIVANCVEVIHADIVGVWNLPDEDRVRRFFLSGLSFLPKKTSTCDYLSCARTKRTFRQGLFKVSAASEPDVERVYLTDLNKIAHQRRALRG
jgi:hypothetical protein